MFALGLILLVVGLVLWLAPTGLRPPAATIGTLLFLVGLVLVLLAVVDDHDGVHSALMLPGVLRLKRRVRNRARRARLKLA